MKEVTCEKNIELKTGSITLTHCKPDWIPPRVPRVGNH